MFSDGIFRNKEIIVCEVCECAEIQILRAVGKLNSYCSSLYSMPNTTQFSPMR